MKTDEYEFLTDIVEAFKTRPQDLHPNDPANLSKWEETFMDSMIERVDKYHANTYVSEKQWAALERVAEKLGVADARQ